MSKVLGRRLFANGGAAIAPRPPQQDPMGLMHDYQALSQFPEYREDAEAGFEHLLNEGYRIPARTMTTNAYPEGEASAFPQAQDHEALTEMGIFGAFPDEPEELDDSPSTVEAALDTEITSDPERDKEGQQKILAAAGDPGELEATIAEQASAKAGGEVTPEQVGEVVKSVSSKHEALGGDPSTFLLDFGLALMASDSPYFMTAVGEAGLVARKSAKERRKERREDKKLALEEKLLQYKAAKLLSETDKDKYNKIIGQLDKLTPGSQQNVLAAMGQGAPVRGIYAMMDYATEDKDPTISNISYVNDAGKRVTRAVKEENGMVFYRDPTAPGGWVEITDSYLKLLARSEIGNDTLNLGASRAQKEYSGLRSRIADILAFIAGQRQAENLFEATKESTPLVRDVVVGAQSLSEAMPKLWTAVTGFTTNKKSKDYKSHIEKDFQEFFEENPPSSEMANWAGSAEAFQAVMFTQAIKYGAALGHTGKSMSDVDLKGWLAAVGANARTKEGFWKITSFLEENLISGYNQDERMFIKKLDPQDQARVSPVDWEKERLDVGQDFGGVFVDKGLGHPRRWQKKPPESGSGSPDSQSSVYSVWERGLQNAYNNGGRAAARRYMLDSFPNMDPDNFEKDLDDLDRLARQRKQQGAR